MQLNGLIFQLPKELKVLIGVFLIVLTVGFFSGLLFVGETSTMQPDGIEEQFLGNEHDEEAEVMKFKKNEKEMLTLIHNHVLSMSIIFFLTGLILCLTKLNSRFKNFLLIEPFVSVIITFGGLYFLWTGISWMKYIVILSGTLMCFCFVVSVAIIGFQITKTEVIT